MGLPACLDPPLDPSPNQLNTIQILILYSSNISFNEVVLLTKLERLYTIEYYTDLLIDFFGFLAYYD
jgi:hypothetical protein